MPNVLRGYDALEEADYGRLKLKALLILLCIDWYVKVIPTWASDRNQSVEHTASKTCLLFGQLAHCASGS